MCHYPLFETLAIREGKIANLDFHQARVERSFRDYFYCEPTFNLAALTIPNEYQTGFFRCRVDYNSHAFQTTFSAYTPREIKTFQLVYTENLDYQFKYTDRKRLEMLKNLQSDEVIIINNGFVSDCTIGNLLFLKQGNWYSPQHYLLKGTQLASLLAEKRVQLVPITEKTLWEYEAVMLINALNPFAPQRAVPITSGSIWR